MCDDDEVLENGWFVYVECGIAVGHEYIYEENSLNP